MDYKAIVLSGVTTIALTALLVHLDYVILDPGGMNNALFFLINILGLFLIFSILYILFTRNPAFQVLGIISLLVFSVLAERFLKISNNPITIPSLILFWIGVTYLLLPQFFTKYWKGILLVYGVVLSYYFFGFISTANYGVNDRADFAKYMVLPIPFFLFLWLYEQWKLMRILKLDRTRAELTLLKNQVNPHFFFNTLNNLYGLIVEKSPQAPAVVLQLSDMMRYTIEMGDIDEVSILDEIKYIENYIALHKIRYRKKVDIRFDHGIENNVEIAPLLFINLVENALKHGAESLMENAYVHISLITKDNQLEFKVVNNYEVNDTKQSMGTGLDNLKKRLVHAYPNSHEFIVNKTENTYTAQLNLNLSSNIL